MKLAPTNFPEKALIISIDEEQKHCMILGDINDENALTIFVKNHQIHNAKELDG